MRISLVTIFIAILCTALGVGGIWSFVLYKGSIISALERVKLVPHEEPFTELFINEYPSLAESLPSAIRQGGSIDFSFTIHNREHARVTYPYSVWVSIGSSKTKITSQEVTLDDNGSISIPVSYVFPSAAARATITVILDGRDESVHFFVPNR